ncbi:MAG TPA: hypothetical protein VN580_12155 [Clostridia bacterium]|nr:hypothetical protein [Clostridia bacterium]
MSLDISLFIKEPVITEEQLRQDIEDFFGLRGVTPIRRSKEVAIFAETDEVGRFYVGIIEKGSTANGVYYDSVLAQGDFQYRQSIWFEIDKSGDISESFNIILRFACYLFKKHPADILLVIIDDDTCLFEKESGNIYLKHGARRFSPQVLEECKVQEL